MWSLLTHWTSNWSSLWHSSRILFFSSFSLYSAYCTVNREPIRHPAHFNTAQFSKLHVVSDGTKRRALPCYQSEKTKIIDLPKWELNPQPSRFQSDAETRPKCRKMCLPKEKFLSVLPITTTCRTQPLGSWQTKT